MSRGINKVILVGNLGRDPELTYSTNGMAIAKFSIATTEGRKNADGQWEDVTEWHNVVLFGKTAETAGQYLTKGSQVYVEGRIHTHSYEQEGVKKYRTEILGNTMRLLGRRDDSYRGEAAAREPGAAPPPAEPAGPEPEIEEDLPF